MSDPVQEQLLGHLLGALDDAEQAEVETRLKGDPNWRRALSVLRERLEPLAEAELDFDPPPGLAERTCRLVAARDRLQRHCTQRSGPPPQSPPASRTRGPAMSPATAPPSWLGRIRWLDVAMAAGLFLAASALIFPAIQHSRFRSRLTACQNNLRELGRALKQYSLLHAGYFPRIPTRGKASAAGIYAPTLLSDNLLADGKWVVCPGSELAGQGRFRVPLLDEFQSASQEQIDEFRQRMGGSYGYCLGYMRDGVYHATKDLNRSRFALMADAPSDLAGYQSLNHSGRGQNVLFEDLRVQFLTSSRPYDADDFYANDYGLVAAGAHMNDSVIGSSSSAPIVFVSNSY